MSPRGPLQTLLSISKPTSPGPPPGFTAVHVTRAILLIGDRQPVGRIELSKRLGLGEGAVRTIVKHLSNDGFLDAAKEGGVLTQRGRTLYRSLRSKLSEVYSVNARQLALDKQSAAVLVRDSGSLVNRGIEQRDAAIRAGATGACTLVYRRGKLVMPMGDNEEWSLNPNDALTEDLKKLFAPKDRDVLAIVSASTADLAEHCAVAAALTFLD